MLARPKDRPYELLSHKWRELAERRRAHFIELYRTGRWKHYYTQDEFVLRMREVFDAAETWARLAPGIANTPAKLRLPGRLS
jgi:uncharacterized repeat protein (TIGR03809 family)